MNSFAVLESWTGRLGRLNQDVPSLMISFGAEGAEIW